MVFVAGRPTTGAFFMFQTPTPLDIHWVDAEGIAVASASMEPCLDADSRDCPRYSPGREYLAAIETFPGGADAIGLSIGSTVELISADTVCAQLSATTP